MEVTGLIIGIIGLVIAYLTYRTRISKKPREDGSFILCKYDFAQCTTRKLIETLTKCTKEHSLGDQVFMQGLTFNEDITLLKSAKNKLFSDEARRGVENSSLGKKSNDQLIDQQDKHINSIQVLEPS